ncbi:DUF2189 domain-containing protein [Dechloromonas denitrificans]|uniref:DUF2189 domain-containing protein n=1 Tax=Dechloromonas denitrificans TaxID=281362 RepID=UPI001CF957D2|nr:DUF2189 domain-containing protein [Dechloromonas denitrificans]
MALHPQPLTLYSLRHALAVGWRMTMATRAVAVTFSLVFVLAGAVIIGGLLAQGLLPFVIVAAGAFMLLGPVILAGFFGIAQAFEGDGQVRPAAVLAGFSTAPAALWVLALVCGLLFMIFVTDATILYAYMLGQAPVWLTDLVPFADNLLRFVKWAAVSGFVVALMLFCVSAFSVPLLCERRAGLVEAVALSVRIVFANFPLAMLWAAVLACVIIGSILLLPVLSLTLPWLAFASRALYRQVLPGA